MICIIRVNVEGTVSSFVEIKKINELHNLSNRREIK